MSIPNETEYDYHDPNNLTAGIAISTMGTFGIMTNSTMIFIYCSFKSERNSFNTICTAKAIANLFILTVVFGGIFVPTIIHGYTPWFPLPVSATIIAIGNAFYACNENITLLIAINRFFAIFFPVRYSRIFGMKTTLILLFCLYVYRFGKVSIEIYYAWTLKVCYLYFSPKFLTWLPTFSEENCNPFEGDTFWFLCMFLLTTSLNVTTFMKIICFYRKKSQTDRNSRMRERKNIRLFFQTVLQDALYIIDLTFTFQLSDLFNHRLWTFLSGTFIWESLHAFDGLVMIIFTERFALLKSCLPTASVPPSIIVGPADQRGRLFSLTPKHVTISGLSI